MRPVLQHSNVVAVDECWKVGGRGNPAEDSRLQGKYLYSRTMFDSNLWDGFEAKHKEKWRLCNAELKSLLVLG